MDGFGGPTSHPLILAINEKRRRGLKRYPKHKGHNLTPLFNPELVHASTS